MAQLAALTANELLTDVTPSLGSPIELSFVTALVIVAKFNCDWTDCGGVEVPKDRQRPLTILSQHEIEEFRVDFLLTMGRLAPKVVVECDGHEFHERTKAQAAKDRRRDRKLQSLGYIVFRFTGAEIYDDPFRCAREALFHLIAQHRERGGF